MENSWEDVSDKFFLNAYDAFVCESNNNIDNDSFDCGVSDSQIIVGTDDWTHRVLECPLATSTQIIPGEMSFTSALTLAEEFIREDAVDTQSTNLKDYLKETAANIVSTINNNYSAEQNINIAPFYMAYGHQGNYQNFVDNWNIFEFVINFFIFSGQSGLHDFIVEKSTELIYGLLEAFFIKGVDLCTSQETDDLETEEPEKETSVITPVPVITLEEESTAVTAAIPVVTLEDDESNDIFDLSSEADQLEKEPSSLSQEIDWAVQEFIKSRSLPKKKRPLPSIVNNEPCNWPNTTLSIVFPSIPLDKTNDFTSTLVSGYFAVV
ncbi:uncharacterized protein LOC141538312 [Cotesia typhae]|uniref:uncharacterized protein LOC141538312 n=1 Tax=Cotesia typhae TaxID=2053667 RepID=UPI003D692BF5